MDAEKRRSSNFTQSDKITLINVVAEFKHVIENKKTDSVTSKEKNETWKKITQIYNSFGPSCPRDVDTLKRMYENKKMLRKSMAVERMEFYKTGGGLPDFKIKTDPCDDLLLSIISSKSVSGMHHNFGGDALQISSTDAAQIFSADAAQSSSVDVAQTSTSLSAQQDFTQCAKEDIESQMEFVFEDDDDELNVGSQSIVECEIITPEVKDQENSPCTSKKWTNYKIPDLRAKKSPALSANNLTRRRPRTVVRHLTTSSVSEKYDKLLDERLELAAFQKEHIQNLIQRENEEHKLKMELLRVQIKKENMLEKTNQQ